MTLLALPYDKALNGVLFQQQLYNARCDYLITIIATIAEPGRQPAFQ